MLKRNIKFPIILRDGVQVRTLEELKENFELESIIEYYFDGRLRIWLEQRFYKAEVQLLNELANGENIDLPQKLCHVFGVTYNYQFDFEEFMNKKEKLSKVKQYTDEPTILSQLDLVALSQDELEQIIQDSKNNLGTTVYLLGESFEVKDTVNGIKYIGINKPLIQLMGTQKFDAKSKNIVFENVLLSAESQMKLKQGIDIKNYVKTIKIHKDQFKKEGSKFSWSSPSPRKIYIYNNVLCVVIGRFISFYDIQSNKLINKIEIYEYEQYVNTFKFEDAVYCLDVENVSTPERGWFYLYKLFKVDLNNSTEKDDITSFSDKRIKLFNEFGVKGNVLNMYEVRKNVNDSDNFEVTTSSIGLNNKKLINDKGIEFKDVGSRRYFGGSPSFCYEGTLYNFSPKQKRLFNSRTKEPVLTLSGTIGEFVIGKEKLFGLSSYLNGGTLTKDFSSEGLSPDSMIGRGSVIVFDLNTGEQLKKIKIHDEYDIVFMKAFEEVLLTWSGFCEIKLWDINTLELINTIETVNDGWNMFSNHSFDIDLCEDKLAVMYNDNVLIYE